MRTTINLNSNLLKKLRSTSEMLGISSNALIAILINSIISKNIFKHKPFNSVKYQDADNANDWIKFHVSLAPPIYEKGLDLRKCFKLSVSFLISFAIVHFLDDIVKELRNDVNKIKKVDNYPLNYIFIAKKFDDIQGYIVFWGIPEEKHLKNLIE